MPSVSDVQILYELKKHVATELPARKPTQSMAFGYKVWRTGK